MREGTIIKQMDLGGSRIVFRYPRWSDLPQYLKMHNEFYREQTMTCPQKLDRARGCRKLTGVLTEIETGQARWLFLEIDGKLRGEGFARKRGANYAVVGLALMQECRGLGLGEEMMLLLEDESRKLHRYRLYLEVWAANQPALSLYKKLEYKETGRKPDFMEKASGGFSDLIEMGKKIRRKAVK
ncbi:MAG: GNAT family N-acetyltransferase [Planctomycetes bacterium]|nr:GNAT family N-acetyltransferase [Planctomycetota bacterium]